MYLDGHISSSELYKRRNSYVVSANETVINECVKRLKDDTEVQLNYAMITNLNREIDILKENGFWIYGADMSGTSSYEEKFSPRTVIVMGSEGDGISQLVRKNCDHITSIPMHGHIDSLNVSVATGILLYEFRRSNPRQSQ